MKLKLILVGTFCFLVSGVSFAGYNYNCCNIGGYATFSVQNQSDSYVCLRFVSSNCWSGSNDVFVGPHQTQPADGANAKGVIACVNHTEACCSDDQGSFAMNSQYKVYAYTPSAKSTYAPKSCGDVVQQGTEIDTLRIGFEVVLPPSLFQKKKTIHQVYWGSGSPTCSAKPGFKVCVTYTGDEQ